jgi:hypothetical protein
MVDVDEDDPAQLVFDAVETPDQAPVEMAESPEG